MVYCSDLFGALGEMPNPSFSLDYFENGSGSIQSSVENKQSKKRKRKLDLFDKVTEVPIEETRIDTSKSLTQSPKAKTELYKKMIDFFYSPNTGNTTSV